jgi:hypothetical protein
VGSRAPRATLYASRQLEDGLRETYDVVSASSMALLGLMVAFTFAMAVNRYDQRKTYEEAEANAIGTEYLRADLLPASEAAQVRALLRSYLDQRVLFYATRDPEKVRQIDARTMALQNEMWLVVRTAAAAQPTPVVALAVTGMNDLINSQGYTQAAWWNRIPHAAWMLLFSVAVISHVVVGYGTRNAGWRSKLLLVQPLAISLSFFLIADIDSPRNGVIRVTAQNLLSVADSIRPP